MDSREGLSSLGPQLGEDAQFIKDTCPGRHKALTTYFLSGEGRFFNQEDTKTLSGQQCSGGGTGYAGTHHDPIKIRHGLLSSILDFRTLSYQAVLRISNQSGKILVGAKDVFASYAATGW